MSSKNAEIAALKAQLAKIQGYALGGGVGGDGNMVLEPMRQDLPQIVSQVFVTMILRTREKQRHCMMHALAAQVCSCDWANRKQAGAEA